MVSPAGERHVATVRAASLKEALVIRERRWNQDKGRQRMALAGAMTLAVFLSGFVIRTAVDWDRLGLAERCAAHPISEGTRIVCEIEARAPRRDCQAGNLVHNVLRQCRPPNERR